MSQNDELDVDFEEGADEFGEEAAQAEAPAKSTPKKKSGGGLMAVVLLLVLGGGGVVAAPFLGIQLPFAIPGLPAPAPAPAVPQEQAQIPAEQQQLPAMSGAPGAAPLVSELAAAPPQPETPAVSPAPVTTFMPTSIDELANAGPVIAAPGLLAEEEDPLTATVNPPAASPADDPFSATVSASAPEAPAPSVEMAETPAIPFPETDPLSAPDALEVAKDFNTQAPVAAVPLSTPVVAPAVVSDEAVKALEGRVAALEKSLENLQGSVATKADIDDIKASLKTIEKSAAKSLESAAVKSARKEVENYKNGVMPDVVKAERPKSSGAVKVSPEKTLDRQVKWVLKSAKPGMAWVAERGSNELKTIVVGDTLTGIGKVTGIIRDSSGHWVVNGTKGYISQ